MTSYGKLIVVITALIFIFIIMLGVAYIVYLRQDVKSVADTTIYLLKISPKLLK
jgi:amino acid permease